MPAYGKTATNWCGKEVSKNHLTIVFSVTPRDFQMMHALTLKDLSQVQCIGVSGWAVLRWSISVEQEQISLH